MSALEVIPGLVLTDAMFELAAAGVAKHAPHVGPLSWERFTDPAGWLNIPDLDGEISKSELTLLCTVEATVKLNVWFRPDVRGDAEQQVPHNHRWDLFHGHLLRGAYSELRFHRANVDPETGRADVVAEPLITHASPAANAVGHSVFHEVVEVHEPGTMSLMVCGHGEFGNWCHLDVSSGRTRRDQPVASFEAMFAALNPHLRPWTPRRRWSSYAQAGYSGHARGVAGSTGLCRPCRDPQGPTGRPAARVPRNRGRAAGSQLPPELLSTSHPMHYTRNVPAPACGRPSPISAIPRFCPHRAHYPPCRPTGPGSLPADGPPTYH